MNLRIVILCIAFCTVPVLCAEPSTYLVGRGIADVTGPVVDVIMMGYADRDQKASGIHTRLYSRAFVIDDGSKRVAFVSIECAMMDQLVKLQVIEKLQRLYGSTYSMENVMLSATHTHSGPGGYLQYALYLLAGSGFVRESFGNLVDGIVSSIQKAHENMVPAHIYLSSGELLNASINRSPSAYQNNPPEERSKYTYDTDKLMTQLKFVAKDGTPLGLINWFAVHLTSMNKGNRLISSDNKGYAALLFENLMNPGELVGQGSFVAAFAQANSGDVSPNIAGPRCTDTGLPCDYLTSTCGNRSQLCVATGPGKDSVESTKIIGTRQFEKARELFNDSENMQPITGDIDYIHQFVNMIEYNVDITHPNRTTETVQLCKPAMGYSFGAGTTDGPGMSDFTQGALQEKTFWNIVRSILGRPSNQQKTCHWPKPILINTGEMNRPFLWQPQVVDTQILRIGQLVIVGLPGEFTTMAGHRIRESILSKSPEGTVVALAGLANAYSSYVTTFEEYQIQRYEGASTIFGPHTLDAYRQQFSTLAEGLFAGKDAPAGPDPPNHLDKLVPSRISSVFDRVPIGLTMGSCVQEPNATYSVGQLVQAKFISGNPANRFQETYLSVEQLVEGTDGDWKVVANDANWETMFIWERKCCLGVSEADIRWRIPRETSPGSYRIVHSGYWKRIDGSLLPYNGTTITFQVRSTR